ncbi:MAG: glutamate--tRNA ligase [Terriglobia bacterium]|nr:glutamate--tRNA ligase [Terriglobia bacterium]
MSFEKPRVRFAPSPTGQLHVGNARTALYNWLFARRFGGDFLLRIEDTDVERSEVRYEAQLLDDLRWLGLDWDEGPQAGAGSGEGKEEGPYGPYRQSERLEIYREHTERLLAEGRAYRCFCTSSQLDAEREQTVAAHLPQIYSGRCRNISPEESAARAASGEPFAVRLRIGPDPIAFHDIVRGAVEFAADAVSDPILVRSSGMPVYNYVVTIDDALMRITHVIRGDDHLSNTPKQVAIYQAFGWPVPQFAHLSTILGPDKTRLSKRHGATSISTFREMGILPEALTNYLALLGWGAEGGTRETFTMRELAAEFTLERVTPSPAIFDFNKLHWLNRHYLKLADSERVAALARPYFLAKNWLPEAGDAQAETWFQQLLTLFLPAVDQLDQLPEKAHFLFVFDPAAAIANEENAAVLAIPSARKVLDEFAARIAALPAPITAEAFKAVMNEVKAASGVKGKELFHPVRIALTGAHSGPEFDKVVPLMEAGAQLPLPTPIPNVQKRAELFLSALPFSQAN